MGGYNTFYGLMWKADDTWVPVLSYLRVPGIKFRSSDSVTTAFTHGPISPAPLSTSTKAYFDFHISHNIGPWRWAHSSRSKALDQEVQSHKAQEGVWMEE